MSMTHSKRPNLPAASKRILAIHDLSGWGHTSLLAAIPIFYHYGIQVAALPTAILSTNTDYPGYVLDDQTLQMQATIRHWQSLGVTFDAIYSGFIGSPGQAELIADAIRKFRHQDTFILIDPVLGDAGELYKCYDEAMIEAMRALLPLADLITPNFTEAALLLGKPWNPLASPQESKELCLQLQARAAKNIVITSVPNPQPERTAVAILTEDASYHVLDCEYLPAVYPGAGDVFASILLAEIMCGKDLSSAAQTAVDFVHKGIQTSLQTGQDRRDGICLERILAWSDE